MSSEYSRSVLKMVVASICQTVGWHSINSTPLEFMVDLMQEYLLRISKLTHQYSEILGRTEPNLDDLGLAFRYMNIDIQELVEYVKNVDSVPCPVQVPQYPVRRENHLNFLKPGSREVVTRPVHIHEHLPAMYPDTEEDYAVDKSESLTNGTTDLTPSSGTSSGNSNNTSPHRLSPQGIFKRPGDPISFESPIVKRAKVVEEGRPLREISSVMMTTSGFLSPAREGKLPEARTPHQVRADSPQPSSYPMVPPELKCEKKPKKVVKKGPEDRKLDKENKKKKGAKELFKPDKIDDSKIKKLVGMKELAKLKPLKPGGGKTQSAALSQELSGGRPSTPKIASPKSAGSPKPSKAAQPKVKATEKVIDLTDSSPPIEKKEDTVDKLPSEPDKQKLNIFKKISKPREEKDKDKETAAEVPHKYKDLDSRECSPALVIDENNEKQQHAAHRNDVTDVKRIEEKKAPHTPDLHTHPTDGDLVDVQSPSSDVYMFDDTDISPPGTPSSTPKTPELNVPTVVEQKRKKKEKTGKKKEPKLKSPKQCVSPKKTKLPNDVVESDVLDRPKTPQAPEPPLHREPNLPPTLPFPFFPAFPPAPGLIPPPMFSRFPLPLGRGGPGLHPAMPNLAIPPRFPNPPIKSEDFPLSKIKPIEREKPLILPPPVELVSSSILSENEKADKEKVDNNKITKMFKPNKELPFMKVPERVIAPLLASAPIAPPLMLSASTVPAAQMLPSKNLKAEKAEKNDTINSKSKEHKKEKKEKLKKKKDKKEKHKDKGEKAKEKKEKAEKREKLEKLKEKKEKKEKKKEKDANKKNTKEDKNPEAVPKITLKLGTASPRPATPDNAPMKKITIKPLLLKKPDEEVKRESSPELAKISALVTRPPKQKSTSKKTEEGILDGSPALPTDSFSANLTSVPPASAPRTKKSIYQSEPLPSPHFDPVPKILNPLVMPQQPPYYFDRVGRQVWICPACGNQDDGSPMIGCDDCDAWYHWVCVGMQVPPADDEDWYCRFCIAKKQELLHDKKKKKRKKKVKVTA
ncbi:PREDICTED: transcription initiation factor TFIID subunit 3 isoform X2 [Dinoponera quadriceps]|uniref:Transcription initiation factor TFIID subunit 3 isoform X2 n=1 Tax=Dinoponera quadriceps TaxID=609295 RepID=A0A6P3XQI9_DINQU|nr:PREDICTED: transcription initiation factor TFIID subunit 3 isoform X2 [Dinoponera quadriceps]